MMYQPAFPSEHMATSHRSGMALRDYFAAQVATWFLTDWAVAELLEDPATSCRLAAEDAYKMADAMLEARKS